MLAKRFLNLLESKGLVEPSVIADLREQMRDLGDEVTPEAISQLLVDNGYLSAAQGRKLLQEVNRSAAPPPAHLSQEDIVMLEAAGPTNKGFTAHPEHDEDEPVPLEAAEPLAPRRQNDALSDLFEDAGGAFPELGGATQLGNRSSGGWSSRNQWDTKLILGGSALLLFLLIALVFLYVSLTRGTAAEVFQAAEEDYRAQAYTQAIAKYDRFLDKYPEDPNASLARVRQGTARLRAAADGDPAAALKVAHDVLPEIENEEAFAAARPELASMLPAIAENSVSRAKQDALKGQMQVAEQQVALAERAMDLVNNPNYIPTSLRPSQEIRIDRILEDMALVQRDIHREKELAATVAAIVESLAENDAAAAYEQMDQLLGKYPGLENSEALRDAVLRIAQKQRDLVQVSDQPLEATTEPATPRSRAQVALANRSGTEAGRPTEEVAFVFAAGSIYGVEVNSGNLLWNYFVGNQTTVHPQAFRTPTGADGVFADAERQELVRVQARDGRLVWRLAIEEPFVTPSLHDQQILVSTESGRLLVVEAETGRSPRQAILPQPLYVGSTLDSQGSRIFQVAEHSNLYVLDADTLECQEVFYLGHDHESIEVPPVLAMGHLFIAENAGTDYAYFHVLAAEGADAKLRRAQDPFRLNGRVLVPPIVIDSRVVVVTDLGAIHVFDVDAAAYQPARQVAQQMAGGGSPMIRYPAAQGVDLWVGDYRLTKYQIQFSRGQLARHWIRGDGDIYVAPLQQFGDVLVQVRRQPEASGVTVSAVRSDSAEVIWQTELAVPAARIIPAADSSQLSTISERGVLYRLSWQQLERGGVIMNQSGSVDAASRAFSETALWPDGRLGFFSSADRRFVATYDPVHPGSGMDGVQLQLPDDDVRVTATPEPLADGLLVPLDSGHVYWFDLGTGAPKALPFQPPLTGGAKVRWHTPVAISLTEFVVGQRQGMVYRVGIQPQPQPHLASLAQVQLPGALVGPLASLDDLVYAVLSTDEGYRLTSLRLPGLEPGPEWPLQSRPDVGPLRLGDMVLVASARDGLLALDGSEETLWQAALPYGAIAGKPIRTDDGIWICSVRGDVWQIALDTGEERQRLEIGQPLDGSAAVLGDQVIVAAADGTLHLVAKIDQP